MPTKNVVPQADAEGGIGTAAKRWNTGSFVSGSFDKIDVIDASGSFRGDGSGLTGIVSSSYVTTASYAETASYVTLAQTASYVTLAQTASYVQDAISSSYALTASYAENSIPAFPFTGSAEITGSLTITGSTNIQDGNLMFSSSSPTISGSGGDFTIYTNTGGDINLVAGNTHQFLIGRRAIWVNPPEVSPGSPQAKLHISGSSGIATEAINILRVDDSTSATQLLVSASNGIIVPKIEVTGTGWNDGYLGNSEFIPLLPIDFNMTEDGTPTEAAIRNYVPSISGSIVGRALTHQTMYGQAMTPPNNLQGPNYVFAQKIIPKGFTATGVRVNTSTTNTNLVNAWSGSVAEVVNTGLGSLLFTNNVSQSSNADASFNYPVIGDGENYVTVQCMTSGSGVIGGGKIYISRT